MGIPTMKTKTVEFQEQNCVTCTIVADNKIIERRSCVIYIAFTISHCLKEYISKSLSKLQRIYGKIRTLTQKILKSI
jgi:hypothetical protein